MRMIIPTGLTALLSCLDQAIQRNGLDEPYPSSPLSGRFVQRLRACRQDLRARSNAHDELKYVWRQTLTQHRRCFAQLSRLVRDSWLILRRRDQREQHGGLLVACYRMPRLSPQHASAAVWLEYARDLVAGDERAQCEGHAPMAFPSASELAACLAEAGQVQADYVRWTLQLKQASVALRARQREAAHLLRCLAARLREEGFEQPEAQTRNLLRSFGFQFKSSPTEAKQVHTAELPNTTLAEPPREVRVATAIAPSVPPHGCLPRERQPQPEPERPGLGHALKHWAHKLAGGNRWIA